MDNDSRRHVGLFRNVFLNYSETFIHDELRNHRRYQTTVFTRQWRNHDRFPGHRVEYVEKAPGERHPLRSLWYGITGHNRHFSDVIQNTGINILHAHFGHNGIYALPFAKAHNIPLVVSLHGRGVTLLHGQDRFHPLHWKYLAGFKKLIAGTSMFLAASSEMKSLMEAEGCPPEKIQVHTLGIDLNTFSPCAQAAKPKRPITLMVGHFIEKKGHEFGIGAAAMARDAGCDFELVMVGDGPLKPACEEQVARHHLEPNVRFTGNLRHYEIRELMQQASVVMVPSVIAKNLDRESGSIVLKEAAACGVAGIGTAHGGIPDIIDHGKTGFIVPERDATSIGKHLIALLSNTALREDMGHAARKKMETEYNIVARVQRLESIYDEVIERHGLNGAA